MTALATLPMYDWPELRAAIDADYAALRVLVPELPAELSRPQTEQDLARIWREPSLLLAQTCWGPMQAGLAKHVHVLAQPFYDGIAGGQGTQYRSVLVMREGAQCLAPAKGAAVLPQRLAGLRAAINTPMSLSGCLALEQDAGLRDLAHRSLVTGSHRASIRAVARGAAEFAAIDCKSWAMALDHEPAARELVVTGWTALRPGLPFITARATPVALRHKLVQALAHLGAQPQPDLQEVP